MNPQPGAAPNEQSDRLGQSAAEWKESFEWGLFTDWCAAAGYPVLPTTWEAVTRFLSDIPCSRQLAARRLRAIHRVHQAHAYQMRSRLPDATIRGSASRTGVISARLEDDQPDRWLSLSEALELLPVYGYPYGVPARRDGFVLVLVALLGLTRAQAANMTSDHVTLTPPEVTGAAPVTVASHPIQPGADPARCPTCAITRWCRALAAWHYQWHTPRAYALEEALYDRPAGHDCAYPVPTGWQKAHVMTPYIGPEGLPAFHLEPITPRTISRITAARRHPNAATGDQDPAHVAAARAGAPPLNSDHDSADLAPPRERVPAWAIRPPMTAPARRTLPDPDGHIDALLDQLEDRLANLEGSIDHTLKSNRHSG